MIDIRTYVRRAAGLLYTALAVAALSAPAARAEPFVVPDDAGVVNVRDHGAVGDGTTDDTEAIRRAVRAALDVESRYGSPRMIYLPAGTYLVSAPIEGKSEPHGWSGGWRAGFLLMGEGVDRTTIRLRDDAEGYGDADKPKWLIATGSESDRRTGPDDEPLGGGGNRAFRHAVGHMAVDVGRGNPGAVGVDFVASNRGTVRDVRIVAPEGSGYCGLRLERPWPGPALVKDVEIEGFAFGIRVAHAQYGMTLENIDLRGQREAGLLNSSNVLAIRNLTSDNAVPAIRGTQGNGLITLLDSKLTGGEGGPAVVGENRLLVRNLKVSGYATAIDDRGVGRRVPASPQPIEVYASDTHTLTGGIEPSDRLELRDLPRHLPEDASKWANVRDFGDTSGPDDYEALQAALDSGSEVVYLPNGSYQTSKTLVVRGPVRTVIGFQSAIGVAKGAKVEPLVRYEGKAGEATSLEHLWLDGLVEHGGAGTLALRHVDISEGYRNTRQGSGDLFTEDTIGKPIIFAHPQNAWMRQVNCEFGEKPLVENHGATVWMLGYKTEGEMVCLRQTGGVTEINSALLYPLNHSNPVGPAMLVEAGRFIGSIAMNDRGYQLHVGTAPGDAEKAVTAREVGNRSSALVIADVERGVAPAKPDADAAPAKAPQADAAAGQIPAWGRDGGNPFKTDSGGRWAAVRVRNTGDWLDGKSHDTLDKWDAAGDRWESRTEMSDGAPSYAPSQRLLRTRPAGGHVAGLRFTPARPGTYRLSGQVLVSSWGPDSPVRLVVMRVNAGGDAESLLDAEAADGSEYDLSAAEVLREVTIKAGESLVIVAGSTAGGTAEVDFDAGVEPVKIAAGGDRRGVD